MDYALLSERYRIRRIELEDVPAVYELCRQNPLYYQHCPPFVTEESILRDMQALPPNKGREDKYYLGYYDGEKLVAVMDLIMGYPEGSTAFIGFFMTEASLQNGGVGSEIIDELRRNLAKMNVKSIRLCWVKGNPQAEHFWRKNGFAEMGVSYNTEGHTVVVAQKSL